MCFACLKALIHFSPAKRKLTWIVSGLEKGNKYLNPPLRGNKNSTVTGGISLKTSPQAGMNAGWSRKSLQKRPVLEICSKPLLIPAALTFLFEAPYNRTVTTRKMWSNVPRNRDGLASKSRENV